MEALAEKASVIQSQKCFFYKQPKLNESASKRWLQMSPNQQPFTSEMSDAQTRCPAVTSEVRNNNSLIQHV